MGDGAGLNVVVSVADVSFAIVSFVVVIVVILVVAAVVVFTVVGDYSVVNSVYIAVLVGDTFFLVIWVYPFFRLS